MIFGVHGNISDVNSLSYILSDIKNVTDSMQLENNQYCANDTFLLAMPTNAYSFVLKKK